jgi:hypothetical protein
VVPPPELLVVAFGATNFGDVLLSRLARSLLAVVFLAVRTRTHDLGEAVAVKTVELVLEACGGGNKGDQKQRKE